MKKIFCLFFSFCFLGVCFSGCKDKGDSGKISLISSYEYGSITPIDIYKIEDGSINFYKSHRTVSVEKKYTYKTENYYEDKRIEIYADFDLLSINVSTYKITWEKYTPAAITFKPSTPQTFYYSSYFGTKEPVIFVANVSFYKTLHIKLEERKSTYKITYYTCEDTAFDSIKEYKNYKKVIEVLKSDIKRIEYIV